MVLDPSGVGIATRGEDLQQQVIDCLGWHPDLSLMTMGSANLSTPNGLDAYLEFPVLTWRF